MHNLVYINTAYKMNIDTYMYITHIHTHLCMQVVYKMIRVNLIKSLEVLPNS